MDDVLGRLDGGTIPFDDLPPKSRFAYEIAPAADGSPLAFPVWVLRGVPGQRLVCVAGVHGNEHEGIVALHNLWNAVDPAELTGTLVMVPVANPPAFRAGMRCNPDDMMDMNRVFPGLADGTTTEQLAYCLFHGVVAGANFVLSMHSFTADALAVPYVEYPRGSPATGASRDAARRFGLSYVEAWDWPEGLLVTVCAREGIPAIEPEIGGLGHTIPERRDRYVAGAKNLLRHLGMLPGMPPPERDVQEVQRRSVTARAGGILLRHVDLGETVYAGQVLATVVDLLGHRRELLHAPVDGIVAAQRLRASVSPGDSVAVLFQPAPGQWLNPTKGG